MNAADLTQYGLRQPYWYQCDTTFAAAAPVGSTGSATLRITDTPFVCTRIIIVSRVASLGTVVTLDDPTVNGDTGGMPDPGVLVSLRETGTDRSMSNVSMDGLVFGFIGNRALPVPKLFKASSTVTADFSLQRQAAGGTAVQVRLILEGWADYS